MGHADDADPPLAVDIACGADFDGRSWADVIGYRLHPVVSDHSPAVGGQHFITYDVPSRRAQMVGDAFEEVAGETHLDQPHAGKRCRLA